MDLEQLMAELMKVTDRAAVVAALQKSAQPVFQLVFDKGHSEATQRATAKQTELQTQLTTVQTELATAKTQLTALGEKAPDLARLQQTHEAQIKQIREEGAQALAKVTGDLTTEKSRNQISRLRSALVERGVNPDYADALLVKPEITNRLRLNAQGKDEVLRAGSEIPFAPAEGQSPLGLLADELLPNIPPLLITSTVDRGSGARTGGGGIDTSAAQFEAIRKEVKAKEAKQRGEGAVPLEQRLGMAPASK